MLEVKQTFGHATLYREETYNGGVSAKVLWIVKVGPRIVRECATRKEAIIWLEMYGMPSDDVLLAALGPCGK